MSIIQRFYHLFRSALLAGVDCFQSASLYLGLPNNGNVGDEYLFKLAQKFLKMRLIDNLSSRGHFQSLSLRSTHGKYLFGGGSLLFDDRFLTKAERLAAFGLVPVLWGTGSRDFPTEHDKQERWKIILEKALVLGIRGKLTMDSLCKLSLKGKIVGDMGYLVNLSINKALEPENFVCINIRLIPTRNPLLNRKDLKTLEILNHVINELDRRGFKIILYIGEKQIDPVLQNWINRINVPTKILCYDGSVDQFFSIISKAKGMLSMKLHPGIFAIALGVPTIFLDARAKYYDAVSVFPEKVAEIIDVDEMKNNEIVEKVFFSLSENINNRRNRFDCVREIAQRQKEYCEQVREILKS